MREQLELIHSNAIKDISDLRDLQSIESFKVRILGRKGELTQILKSMGSLPAEERPIVGEFANKVRTQIEKLLNEQMEKVSELELVKRLKEEVIDVTVPGKRFKRGNLHPLNIVMNDIKDIFIGLGFSVAEGPEIEYDYYNFEALNTPKHHPARDVQDTFYVTENILLRTHTSPMQVRVMEKQKPPIRIIVPGRVYRSDAVDATHSPIFHQVEGLYIDKNVGMGDLKGILDTFAKELFGHQTRTKFRPHHFPFTEPSAEMDASCSACGGEGCRICSYTGWIEILGAGMVHPKVLKNCGIDPDEYSGFAFGMGVDRITNLRYGIDDIRLLFENDLRFLQQF